MTLLHGISLYNQDRLGDANFVENFVARHEVLAMMLAGLRYAIKEREIEHHVLIGARGMGKTSLLRRIGIAIAADETLRHQLIPLRFREEQYNVISLDAFWRNCGEALAEYCEANGRYAQAASLDRAAESPEWRDADTAAARFLDACNEIGGRPCLLIDNLDLILNGLDSQECWSLRGILQKRTGPLVIGAATHFLAQGAQRDAAFYEFFNPFVLEPLSEAELLRCMRALADMRGEAGAPVRTVLAREPERLRTLYTLTGGNPRILALIYQLLERAESDAIFADLEALLDQVTPFYKARIEEYQTPQQRAVIDAIALHWDPITSGALSDVTGIEVTTISSQLSRLRRDGFIEQVPTSGARDGYQLGERFLNIWYLMRHGTRKTKQRLKWLTIFLTRLFSADELGRMAAQAKDKARAGGWHPDFRDAVVEAHDAINEISTFVAEPKAGFNDASAGIDGSAPAPRDGQSRPGENGTDIDEARSLMSRASEHHRLGQFADAITAYDAVAHRFGSATDTALQEQVVNALFRKSRMLFEQFGRYDEAENGYRRALKLTSETFLKAGLAWALIAQNRAGEARAVRDDLSGVDAERLALISAGIEIVQDNIGIALGHLADALERGLEFGMVNDFEDLLWLLRIAEARGHGERLIEWFQASGHAERYAPVFGAFVAHVRGERCLLDLNPEVRDTARGFYETLSAPRRHRAGSEPAPKPRRGRRRPK